MERKLQERMIGAGVLILALVVFGPMVLDGGPRQSAEAPAPPGQRDDELRTHTFNLNETMEVAPPSTGTTAAAVPPSEPLVVPAPEAAVPPPATAPVPEPIKPPPAAAARVPVDKPVTGSEAPPPPAAAQARQGWLVQVGTFGQKANADRLLAKLQDEGYEAFVSPTARGDRTLYRVRVGPPGPRDDAMSLAKRLAAAGHQGQLVSQ